MATNAIQGYKGKFLASSSEGGSPAALAELTDYTVNVNHAPIEATSHDSSGTREYIGGIDDWDGSATLHHVITNSGHKNLFDRTVGKEPIDIELYPTGSSSDGFFSGTCFVSGFTQNSGNDGTLGVSVNFQGDGALARSSSST